MGKQTAQTKKAYFSSAYEEILKVNYYGTKKQTVRFMTSQRLVHVKIT